MVMVIWGVTAAVSEGAGGEGVGMSNEGATKIRGIERTRATNNTEAISTAFISYSILSDGLRTVDGAMVLV